MKISISTANDTVIDYLVAKCENLQPLENYSFDEGCKVLPHPYYAGYDFGFYPSTDWEQGGPIISREIMERGLLLSSRLGKCEAVYPNGPSWNTCYGSTPLVAAMRCYITSKLGAEVDVPDEFALLIEDSAERSGDHSRPKIPTE